MENGKQETKNVPLTAKKCPMCQFTNCCKLADSTFFSGEWDVFVHFWFNLINILIFAIYYTYIYSNIHNLSDKELKSLENPIFKTQIETQTQF